MTAAEKVVILIRLTRQLVQVMDAETDMLRRVQLAGLRELQVEKQSLADVYAVEFAEVQRDAAILGGAEESARRELEDATRAFQAAARRNTAALEASRVVIERALDLIRDSLAESRHYGPRPGSAERCEVLPFALDRSC